jgi:RimJ/RimL family protein N-acetyltransferase
MDRPLARSPQPTLESPRLRLRQYRDDDVDALFALQSDLRVMRYWSYPAWTERRQAEQKLADIYRQLRESDVYIWAIADRGSDRMIGNTALFSLDRDQSRGELGYSLMTEWQGRGLAQEAVRLVLGFAFDELQLERIEADIDPRNAPSRKLVERLGFVCEGLLRERWRVNGEICDAAFYGLLRREFVAASGHHALHGTSAPSASHT